MLTSDVNREKNNKNGDLGARCNGLPPGADGILAYSNNYAAADKLDNGRDSLSIQHNYACLKSDFHYRMADR